MIYRAQVHEWNNNCFISVKMIWATDLGQNSHLFYVSEVPQKPIVLMQIWFPRDKWSNQAE